jgi:hypothetical protein
MSAKRSRALRAGLESLERRETPSTHTLAAAAATTKVADISGKGFAAVILSQPIINGQKVVTMISGSAPAIGGSYTGELDVFYGLDRKLGAGTGVITTSTGATINLSLKSTVQVPTMPLGQGDVIKFKVTGGTGTFANATGHGTLTGHVNYLFNFPYVVTGRIKF